MDRVILQVPMSKELKEKAEAVSADYGFSSLQEIIRVLINKLAKREMEVNITESESVKLSPQAKRRYQRMTRDFKEGKNIYSAKNIDEFLKQLNA